MRVLIDTCIYINLALDRSLLSEDVLAILTDYDTTICVSSETVRELIIQFNNGKLVSKYWKTGESNPSNILTYSSVNLNGACSKFLPPGPIPKINPKSI